MLTTNRSLSLVSKIQKDGHKIMIHTPWIIAGPVIYSDVIPRTAPRSTRHTASYWPSADSVHWPPKAEKFVLNPSTALDAFPIWGLYGCNCQAFLCKAMFSKNKIKPGWYLMKQTGIAYHTPTWFNLNDEVSSHILKHQNVQMEVNKESIRY